MMHESGEMWGWFGFGHGPFGWLLWLLVILIIAALVKYLFQR